ncbi:phage tail terminator protein [Phenylobacterium ferrooxidans]|uniref:Phage tail protein n=1 Tax=Phenylobacterium ferrooxidans TaxID=2982689 RepID=A0ABW6CJT6_9CAUL
MQGLYDASAERLRASCPSILQVATGMDASQLVETLAIGPDVSVLLTPLGDRAHPVRDAGLIVTQGETWRMGATLVLTFPGGFAQFEAARDEMKGALRGWQPPGAVSTFEYAGSRLLQYSAGQDGGRWMTLFEFTFDTQETYGKQS